MPETEPRVNAADVIAVLKRRIVEGAPDESEQRAAVAARAGVSTETVKRVMDGRWDTLDLGRADGLLVAAGGHISECRLVWE